MEKKAETHSRFRLITFIVVLAVHVGVIFIPLGVMLWMPEKPKPVAFRVKLGGNEPSRAPEVGPPSRLRPTGNTGSAAPVQKPRQPEAKPKSEANVQPKPKPKPKPKSRAEVQPKPKAKPKPRPKPKAKVRPRSKVAKQVSAQKKSGNPRKEVQPKRSAAPVKKRVTRKVVSEVHHDSRWDNLNPDLPAGGTNTNIAVPIGDRERGQALGKTDNRTPAGGATVDEEKFWEKVTGFLDERWQPPAGIFVSAETAVVIKIEFDDRGRVLRKYIVKVSPNPAVTDSVKRMLNELDYIPAPPAGSARSFSLRMVSQ